MPRGIFQTGLGWTLLATPIVCVSAIVLSLRYQHPLVVHPAEPPKKVQLSQKVDKIDEVESHLPFAPVRAEKRVAPVASGTGASSNEAVPDNTVGVPEQAAALAEKFQRDVPPTPDSRHVESMLRSAFFGPDAEGTSVESLECRGTTCKIEVVFPSLEVDISQARRLFLLPKPELDFKMDAFVPARTLRPDGSRAATIYLVKPDEAAKATAAREAAERESSEQ